LRRCGLGLMWIMKTRKNRCSSSSSFKDYLIIFDKTTQQDSCAIYSLSIKQLDSGETPLWTWLVCVIFRFQSIKLILFTTNRLLNPYNETLRHSLQLFLRKDEPIKNQINNLNIRFSCEIHTVDSIAMLAMKKDCLKR